MNYIVDFYNMQTIDSNALLVLASSWICVYTLEWRTLTCETAQKKKIVFVAVVIVEDILDLSLMMTALATGVIRNIKIAIHW